MQTSADKWNELYSQPDSPWKGGPLQAVQDYIEMLIKGEAADLGAGDGRDSLFIASHGGKVSAFDISEAGLTRLSEAASQLGVGESVRTTAIDLAGFTADKKYQNAVSAFTLHFLTSVDGLKVVKEMQNMTEPGGLNIVADFSAPFPNEEDKDKFYPGPNRLSEMYKDWEILSLVERERKTRQRDESGNQNMKQAFELVARKTS